MKIGSDLLAASCTALVLLFYAQIGEAAQPQQVFLVQNSGWMEPFYADPASQFKPLVEAVIRAVVDPDEQLAVAAFSQKTATNMSPFLVHSGKVGTGELHNALGRLSLASKGRALADADFQEAVESTITALQGRPGILWIFTNNKNSPKNDPDTVRRNGEFYNLLHNSSTISRTIAFPIGMPVKGKWYSASGLMIYALAYGHEADQKLRSLVNSGRIAKVLTNKPLRLKPLDADPVEFSAEAAGKASGGRSLHVSFDGGRMFIDFDADDSNSASILFRVKMTNIFNPYRINHAKVSAGLTGAWRGALGVSPVEIDGINPGEGKSVEISIPIPVSSVPSLWSPSMLRQFGKTFTLQNQMQVTLDEQTLSIPSDFWKSMQQIFPGDPMPDIFTPPDRIRKSTVTLPVIVRIHYPVYPFFVIGGALAALILGLFALFLRRKIFHEIRVMVNNREESFSLKRFGDSADVKSNGVVVAKIAMGWKGPRLSQIDKGQSISIIT